MHLHQGDGQQSRPRSIVIALRSRSSNFLRRPLIGFEVLFRIRLQVCRVNILLQSFDRLQLPARELLALFTILVMKWLDHYTLPLPWAEERLIQVSSLAARCLRQRYHIRIVHQAWILLAVLAVSVAGVRGRRAPC